MKKSKERPLIRTNRGITLIALVITIIVLLILAGVSLNLIAGSDGILGKATKATLETRGAQVEEIVEMWKVESKMNPYAEGDIMTEEELIADLKRRKLVYEEELDEDEKTIVIGSREIYYGLEGKIEKTPGSVFEYTPEGIITGIKEEYIEGTGSRWVIDDHTYYDTKIMSSGLNGVLNIPDEIDGIQIVGISNGAFDSVENVNRIILPNTITSIGNNAFFWCSLESISIPNSVTTIGDKAFYECDYLSSVKLPSGLITIPDDMFYNCRELKDVTIPKSVTSIGDNAFNSCVNLENITIPDGVTSIGHRAFFYCKKITDIVIPDSVRTLRSSVFGKCENLSNIVIGKGITSIEDYVFWNTAISDIVIPEGVTSIGDYAFDECKNLTSIRIPDSVQSVGSSAFSYCSSLNDVLIGNSVEIIGKDAFRRCESLSSVLIPVSVKEIGNCAFYYCPNLKTINYTGTEEQWKSIIKYSESGGYNDALYNSTINYNCSQ